MKKTIIIPETNSRKKYASFVSGFLGCWLMLGSHMLFANEVMDSKNFKQEKQDNPKLSPQIKIIPYQPNHVIDLQGTHFITTNIQFSKHEKILGIYMGDMVAWTYAINPVIPNLLFIKPTLDKSETNMSVITNLHSYYFHLIADKEHSSNQLPIYKYQFSYEAENTGKQNQIDRKKSSPVDVNKTLSPTSLTHHCHYQLSGSTLIRPKEVFDDGRFTYFIFNPHDHIPAVFKWDHGREKALNTQIHGSMLIAKCITESFVLVSGDEKAWVENKH